MIQKVFKFKSKVWIYPFPGASAWYFVTLPKDISDEINFFFTERKRGFGSLKVEAKSGDTKWKTSIFSDKGSGSFVLPLKADVRKKENMIEGDKVEFQLEVI